MKTKLLIALFLLFLVYSHEKNKIKPVVPIVPDVPTPVVVIAPKAPDIGDYTLPYQSYEQIMTMVKDWESKAPLLVETGTYGKTLKGKNSFYFRITNENSKPKYRAIITACIHGNEPWSTSTIIAYSGWILSEYGKDERITKVLDCTEVYFVPVLSPDSYPNSRQIEGVDPNRNFPNPKQPDKKSVTPVRNIMDFFNKIQPNAILSGHTYGRVFLVPWGDSRETNPNSNDYEKIVGKMGQLAGYRHIKAAELYGSPIVGGECDWYHRHGAFSIVMEFGSHQRKPSEKDTESEFEKTKEAFLLFLEESVKVEIVKENSHEKIYCPRCGKIRN